MKLMTLNLNKFNYDVSKLQALTYINAVGADLTVLQEYTHKVAVERLMLCNHNITDNRVPFTAAVSGSYKISEENEDNLKHILLEPKEKPKYPTVLGVHITDEIFPKSRPVIVCGDFNRGYNPYHQPDNPGERFYQSLLKEGYTDLWAWGIKSRRAFYTDCFGTEHATEKDKFYRTFNTQRVNDCILCKNDFAPLLTKIVIDYRTLTFTDHCAVIAEFNI